MPPPISPPRRSFPREQLAVQESIARKLEVTTKERSITQEPPPRAVIIKEREEGKKKAKLHDISTELPTRTARSSTTNHQGVLHKNLLQDKTRSTTQEPPSRQNKEYYTRTSKKTPMPFTCKI
jgi:hypothetical protein